MGIHDKPIAPGSPWQNGFAEIGGSLRLPFAGRFSFLAQLTLPPGTKRFCRFADPLKLLGILASF